MQYYPCEFENEEVRTERTLNRRISQSNEDAAGTPGKRLPWLRPVLYDSATVFLETAELL